MLIRADARRLPLPAESVQTVVTSPPYWGLRDYGLEAGVWGGEDDCKHEWGGAAKISDVREPIQHGKSRTTTRFYEDESRRFDGNHQKHRSERFCVLCGAWLGCLGLEPTPELYVEHLVGIFREVRRVLRKDGTLWMNLGDCFANDGKWGGRSGGKHVSDLHGNTGIGRGKRQTGLKPKDLVGVPWRVAFALQADGWWLRSEIIWHKPNPMPESVRDRPTRSHEQIFLLSKSGKYFYDGDAIREPISDSTKERWSGAPTRKNPSPQGLKAGSVSGEDTFGAPGSGRNKRSVWTVATKPYPGAHFAAFPPDLIAPCILAGSKPGDYVLDPFGGTGTVMHTANMLGRRGISSDLAFQELARRSRFGDVPRGKAKSLPLLEGM